MLKSMKKCNVVQSIKGCGHVQSSENCNFSGINGFHEYYLCAYLQSLERTERMMVRWMCGVSLKDRKRSVDLYNLLGVESVAEVVAD